MFVAQTASPQAPIFCRLNLRCQFLHSLALNLYQNLKRNLQIILFFFFFAVECEIFGIPAILSAKICSYRGVDALVPLVGRWEKKAEGAGRVSVLCLSKEQEEICTHCGPGMKIRHQGEFTESEECRLAKSVCLRAFKHSWMPTSCVLALGIQR